MRSGDPGWEVSRNGADGSWKINREPGHAWKSRGSWGTDFSCFRFAIPELCGFDGKAIYLDADMLVLGDIAELASLSLNRPWLCRSGMTDVSVIDCKAMRGLLPSIAEMKPSGRITFDYVQMLTRCGAIDPSLPAEWNARDSADLWVPATKLLHYTTVPWQPWRPYPCVTYYPHPLSSWVIRWEAEKAEADASRTPAG